MMLVKTENITHHSGDVIWVILDILHIFNVKTALQTGILDFHHEELGNVESKI